mmetsp:Transcript_52745/g.140736  ORF Transcript_52745/g.140736 Transcript_52745/m.140736 type:complete len:446 (-) Transcript_52745:111-1448(-)
MGIFKWRQHMWPLGLHGVPNDRDLMAVRKRHDVLLCGHLPTRFVNLEQVLQVHGWHSGEGQERPELVHIAVRHSNGFGVAALVEQLHHRPQGLELRRVSGWCVQHVQIHVVHAQVLQLRGEDRFRVFDVYKTLWHGGQLRGEEDLFPGHSAVADRVPDELLVRITFRRVDVSDTSLESPTHGLVGLAAPQPPGSEANGGHLLTRQESEGSASQWRLSVRRPHPTPRDSGWCGQASHRKGLHLQEGRELVKEQTGTLSNLREGVHHGLFHQLVQSRKVLNGGVQRSCGSAIAGHDRGLQVIQSVPPREDGRQETCTAMLRTNRTRLRDAIITHSKVLQTGSPQSSLAERQCHIAQAWSNKNRQEKEHDWHDLQPHCGAPRDTDGRGWETDLEGRILVPQTSSPGFCCSATWAWTEPLSTDQEQLSTGPTGTIHSVHRASNPGKLFA